MFTKEDALLALAICAGGYALGWIILGVLVLTGLI